MALFPSLLWLHNIPYSKRMRRLAGVSDSVDLTDAMISNIQETVSDRGLESCSPWVPRELEMPGLLENNHDKYSVVRHTHTHTQHATRTDTHPASSSSFHLLMDT